MPSEYSVQQRGIKGIDLPKRQRKLKPRIHPFCFANCSWQRLVREAEQDRTSKFLLHPRVFKHPLNPLHALPHLLTSMDVLTPPAQKQVMFFVEELKVTETVYPFTVKLITSRICRKCTWTRGSLFSCCILRGQANLGLEKLLGRSMCPRRGRLANKRLGGLWWVGVTRTRLHNFLVACGWVKENKNPPPGSWGRCSQDVSLALDDYHQRMNRKSKSLLYLSTSSCTWMALFFARQGLASDFGGNGLRPKTGCLIEKKYRRSCAVHYPNLQNFTIQTTFMTHLIPAYRCFTCGPPKVFSMLPYMIIIMMMMMMIWLNWIRWWWSDCNKMIVMMREG